MEQKRSRHSLDETTSLNILSVVKTIDRELNQSSDEESLLSVALDAAVRLSQADAAFIGVIDGDRISLKHSYGAYANLSDHGIYDGITGRVIRTRQAEQVLDVQQDLDYLEIVPITRAQMVFPLLSRETLLGVLNLESSDPDRFTPEIFTSLQLLTARVGTLLDNARLNTLAQGQRTELRELEQLKTDIIRVASHDIRSPLSVVNGYLEMLADDLADTLTDEHRFFFDAMFSAMRRMQRMASDILSLDRVQSWQDKPQTLVYMNDVAHKALLDVRDEAKRHGHTLQAFVPEEPLAVYGADTDLNEAIDNLLDNAIKYTPEGGHIALRLTRIQDNGRDWALLEVEDNGPGIEETHQARLFHPFYRVKARNLPQVEGIGLGLYVVKKLVEFHGGRIRFRSTYGKGSVFGFQIPLANVEER